MIKRILLGTMLTLLASAAFAQDHAEVGVFFNYTRLNNAHNENFYGLGGRLGVNVSPSVQLEVEGAYDFSRSVSVSVGPTSGSNFAHNVSSGLRMVHFLAGPKFQIGGSSPIRLFLTVKGGLINFSGNRNFANQVSNIPNGVTDGVLYPAGGIELFAGWLGARAEIGDEIYFDHGANSNLRITAGPVIRF